MLKSIHGDFAYKHKSKQTQNALTQGTKFYHKYTKPQNIAILGFGLA